MSVERYAIEGAIVPDDAFHPMVYAGTCLRCGAGDMAPGCETRNLGDRLRALAGRGVCDHVLDLLRSGGRPADVREVECLTDAQIMDLNAVADARAREDERPMRLGSRHAEA